MEKLVKRDSMLVERKSKRLILGVVLKFLRNGKTSSAISTAAGVGPWLDRQRHLQEPHHGHRDSVCRRGPQRQPGSSGRELPVSGKAWPNPKYEPMDQRESTGIFFILSKLL